MAVDTPAHEVVMLLYDGLQALDATGPLDAFAAANALGADYRITHTGIRDGTVVTNAGTRLAVDIRADRLEGRIDTLIVPGAVDWQAALTDHALVDAVRTLADRSRRTVSICAGAFPLAATGLLDGRTVATHWRLARHLAARFPALTVDPAAIFITDGSYTTSAGVTAGIDLTLSLIERDHGAAIARDVARELVVFMSRPGDQSQFSVRLQTRPTTNPTVRRVMDAITADPQRPHSLTALADVAGVSSRHLSRLFQQETGHTPQHFLDRTRLEAACSLLTTGHDTFDVIAERTGVGSDEALRRLFQRELSTTPSQYRQRFRSVASSRLSQNQ